MNNTYWVYGNSSEFGWGAREVDIDYETIDFTPEFETKYDVKLYWANRRKILRLKNMTLLTYIKTLYRGLTLYRKLI